ncbi:MAG: GntR family transcriptional regulator, partial [Pyrinomonadaceae bacterium]
WLSKNSEISIHEQLVAQISLGIASYDLEKGERLPSTREIARRFQVHANTVNAAYRELAEKGLVEFHKGSGVFVREMSDGKNDSDKLDQIIGRFLRELKKSGFSLSEIQNRLKYHIELQPPDHFLIVESDEGMRRILTDEICDAVNLRVRGVSIEDFLPEMETAGTQIVALYDEREKILPLLSSDKSPIFLKINSVSASMKNQPRPSEKELIAIASGWERFLQFAKTFLLAAQVDAEALVLRSTKDENWRKGLENASMIICDSLTAKKLSKLENVRAFRLIADESLNELKNLYGENPRAVR